MVPGFLTACGTNGVDKPAITQTRDVYPQLPSIDRPAKPDLTPVPWEFPRKPDGSVDAESNLFVGLSQDAKEAMDDNWQKMQAYTQGLIERLDLEDKRRAEWRQKNAAQAEAVSKK